MKALKYKIAMLSALVILAAVSGCKKDFLERTPIGSISEATLNNKTGINGLLVGAYSLLDGVGNGNTKDNIWTGNTSPWSPWLGSVASDDSRKGGGYGSQTERQEIENYKYTSQNVILNDEWKNHYAGVQRANEVLRILKTVPEGEFTAEEALQVKAEAIFLRAVYLFEAAKIWRNIPYVDETITFSASNFNVKNDVPIWPKIEEDFKFAADNLSPAKEDIGRANNWAAKAFLAKTYLFDRKFAEAKPILEDIIANGVTANGIKYALMPKFAELFQESHENNSEAVFAIQMSVNEDGSGYNGNAMESTNYPPFYPTGGWGNQPSFSLVNSYKTLNGLPMLNTFNDEDLKNDMGLELDVPFIAYTGTVDPRLDWTVGRRHLPFHDYGLYEARFDVGGPYRSKKVVYWQKDVGATQVIDGWQQANGANFSMIRFADVLLWAAEVEVEIGSLQKAEEYVNIVRSRAANSSGFLMTYIDNANPSLGFTNTPAANYDIALYNGDFEAGGQQFARESVRFERKLELGMEGHRFFDLQRYDLGEPGYMADLLNKYIAHERATQMTTTNADYLVLENASFIKGKNEIYAIPQEQIDQSKDKSGFTLIQNPGHN
jgi:hypothetical protein